MRWFALVVAASLMAACSSIDRFSDDLRERLLSRLQNAAPQTNDEDPLYCYRTIADEDCYDTAQPGAEQRLIEKVGSPQRPE